MAKTTKAAVKAKVVNFGDLFYIQSAMGQFKASDYAGVQRAVQLKEILDSGTAEYNIKLAALLNKFGFEQGDEVPADHPKRPEIQIEVNKLLNEDSSVLIRQLQIFTVEEFTKDAVVDGKLSYQDAGVLGKWLVKEG